MLVLQIFKHHARTKEAKLQTALAEIPYYHARMGFYGTDDMLVQLKQREVYLKHCLEELKGHRAVLRQSRRKFEIPVTGAIARQERRAFQPWGRKRLAAFILYHFLLRCSHFLRFSRTTGRSRGRVHECRQNVAHQEAHRR